MSLTVLFGALIGLAIGWLIVRGTATRKPLQTSGLIVLALAAALGAVTGAYLRQPPKGPVAAVSPERFRRQIAQGVTLVDFYATWCGPCKSQAPILEEVAGAVGNQAALLKVDVDKSRELADLYEIQALPTLILFVNGDEERRFTGLTSKRELVNAIEQVQPSIAPATD